MQAENRPLVSFVVPTLNRGWYVSRAVDSCLRNASESVNIEVVVVDSSSDDGSFEDLQAKFGSDTRVRLIQNSRTSGPLKSWIEGVEAATGDFMTFVWSDDVISPTFLQTLLPPLQNGAWLAHGLGKNFAVDSEMEFSDAVSTPEQIDGQVFLGQYYGHKPILPSGPIPSTVSPACSLFHAELVREWTHHVQDFCRATPLREQIMWRRAIGPDLMLYLLAMSPGCPQVAFFRTYTAQFSEHSESISISSNRWIFKAGYWLAKRWYIEKYCQNDDFSHGKKLWAETFWAGRRLLRNKLLRQMREDKRPQRLFFGFLREIVTLLISGWRRGFLVVR